jgi:hypothetical protein
MKRNKQKLNFSLASILLALILLSGCTGNSTTSTKLPPAITTAAVSNIAASSALSGGTVTSDGGAAITAQGICWSTSPAPTTSSNYLVNTAGTSPFASSITGLAANTTYYVRAFATNSEGTSYGNEITFTTSQATAPTIPSLTTTAASAIGSTTAATGGNVTSDGGSAISARGVCWSTTSGPTVALSTKTSDGTGSGSFTSSITGLTALTTYYARAYATNALGTAYGNEISFATTAVSANTAGTLTVSTSTSTAGGGYNPANVVAIWIRTSTGTFVKSLLVYAATRKSHLTTWYSNSAANVTDATTGATQSSYAIRTCTWNGTNTSGTVVANGDYKVCMELADGNVSYHEFAFTKGATAVTLSPANVSSFSNISIKWTPN